VVTSSIPTPPGHKSKKKRINNVIVDHIVPIIDPAVGFVSWDLVVASMFCELANLQVMCRACSDKKTATERDVQTQRKRNEKNANR
jgi:5-methylcytosine-specific restriction endonuclease McrA